MRTAVATKAKASITPIPILKVCGENLGGLVGFCIDECTNGEAGVEAGDQLVLVEDIPVLLDFSPSNYFCHEKARIEIRNAQQKPQLKLTEIGDPIILFSYRQHANVTATMAFRDADSADGAKLRQRVQAAYTWMLERG